MLAALGPHLEGIHVEVLRAVQGYAGENTVVQRALHHVAIAAVGADAAHAHRRHDEGDGRAGFVVAALGGQVVVDGVGFAHMGGAHAAGDVHLLVHNVVQHAGGGVHQGGIAIQAAHLRHAGQQIPLAHRVAHGHGLLADGHMGLVIHEGRQVIPAHFGLVAPGVGLLGEVVGRLSPGVEEIGRQAQIALAAGGFVQPGQAQLDLLMAGAAVLLVLAGAELAVQAVGKAAGNVQQGPFARGGIVGRGSLEHVAGHIQLMVVPQVGEALVQAVDNIVGIQIAVALLGLAGQGDGLVRLGLQGRVGMGGQGVGNALHPLPQVAVLEAAAVELSLFKPRGNAEVLHAVAGRHAGDAVVEGVPHVGDGGVPCRGHAGGEESVVNIDAFQGQGLKHGNHTSLVLPDNRIIAWLGTLGKMRNGK